MPIWKSKTRHDFHESYYEHSCAIIDEKDVLETDIPGRTCTAKFMRWWHGLFLLSCNDERNRIYYSSSQAMRMERTRQFRRYRGRIHPLSQFRFFWDLLMLAAFLTKNIVFNHNTSFLYGQINRSFYYVAAAIEIIVIVDIYINMKTGYHKIRKIVLEKFDGILHYSSTKLFLHVASAIPLQWIMFLRYGANFDCALCKTDKFTSTVKVINLFGLFRVYECSSYWVRGRSNYNWSFAFKLLRISVISFFTMLHFVDLMDTITLQIMISDGQILRSAYVGLLMEKKYIYDNPFSDYKFLVLNFSRICKSLLLFGFAYKRTKFYLDIMASLCVFIIANVFYTWSILECFNYIHCTRFCEDKVIGIKKAMNTMVHYRQLPDKVTKKLWKYYDFHQSKIKAIERHNYLYRCLPDILKREIVLASYTKYIKRISYFTEWPPDVIDGIVLMLKEEIFSTSDMVAEPWAQSEGLMIVATGEVAVYTNQEETGHLIDGDYFGELSLVTNKEMRSSSVIAISPCVILLLEKRDFRRYMRQYSHLFYALKQELKDKHGEIPRNNND